MMILGGVAVGVLTWVDDDAGGVAVVLAEAVGVDMTLDDDELEGVAVVLAEAVGVNVTLDDDELEGVGVEDTAAVLLAVGLGVAMASRESLVEPFR
jgi:hypothetical protein